MIKAELTRLDDDGVQTLGMLTVFDDDVIIYTCKTLELSWNNNEKGASCIPKGKYNVIKRTSEKYGKHFHVLAVPSRTYILIHPANFVRQLKGCIAVGKAHKHIDDDGLHDVTSSKDTMNVLLHLLVDDFELTIKNKMKVMKGKEILKSVLAGANEVLPTFSIKKNKEEKNGTAKGKINYPKLLASAGIGLLQAILVAKGMNPEIISKIAELFGM